MRTRGCYPALPEQAVRGRPPAGPSPGLLLETGRRIPFASMFHYAQRGARQTRPRGRDRFPPAEARSRMKRVGILQPSYLPWLGYFEQIARCDVFVLYDDVQYDKGGWRNRNRVKIPGGPHWLTVPVLTKGGNFPLLRDVRINNSQPWARNHLKTLAQYYSKAPHFGRYFPGLQALLERGWDLLALLDRAVIEWLCGCFGIATPLVWSSELGVEGDRLERLAAIVRHFGGDVFYEGAAGKDYIPEGFFAERGVSVEFQDYRHPVYPQLHGGFVSHLSAVDLLFNVGPASLGVLLGDASGA